MLKQTLKTPILLLIGFLAALMLAACGGGGSGSGAPPSPLVGGGVETDGANAPTKDGDTYVLREDSVLTLKLSNASGLKASLAGVDIRSLFTMNGNKASVSAYALQGIFASTNNAATLEVSVAGSSKSTLQLKYLAKPELVFTKVKGTGTGFDGTGLVFPKKSGGDYGVASTSEWPKNEVLPTSGEYLTVEGIVRGALAVDITGDLKPATPSPSNQFESDTLGVLYEGSAIEGEADFSFTVTADNGEVNTINLAMPGKVISDMFALQISDIGSNHVISQWVSDSVKSYLTSTSPSNPLQVVTNNADACDLILQTYVPKPIGPVPTACDVRITKVTKIPNGAFDFSSSVNFTPMKSYRTPALLQPGWNVETILESNLPENGYLNLALEVIAYNANDDVMATAKFEARVKDIKIKANTNIGKPKTYPSTSTSVLALEIDYNDQDKTTGSFTIGYQLTSLQPKGCTPNSTFGWNECATAKQDLAEEARPIIREQIDSAIAGLAACMQAYVESDYSVSGSSCGFGGTPPEKIGSHLFSNGSMPIFVDPAVADDNKEVVSAVEKAVNDSNFVSIAGQKSGFTSFSGWEKVRDDGVHLNAIGTHFAPTNNLLSAQVKQGQLANENGNDGNDVNLAISSNWINQMLLAAYQSKQLAGKDEVALCQKNDQNAYITPCKNLESLVNGAAPIVMQAIKSQVTNPIAVGVVADAVTPVRVHKLLRGLIKVEDSVGYQWTAHKAAPYVQFTNKKLELVASDISLKAWLIADIVGRLDNACTSAFSDYNGLGKADIVAGCKSALYVNGVRRDLLLASETGASHESVYIDVPSADIKVRMENTPSGVVESFAQDDFAIYINEPVGGTFPMGVLDAQSAIIPQLAQTIANLPTAVLADSTHCIVRKPTSTNIKLIDAFFDWGTVDVEGTPIEKQRAERKFSLLTSEIRIDTADVNTGEASHIIVAAKLLEGLQVGRLMGVTLEYKASCP